MQVIIFINLREGKKTEANTKLFDDVYVCRTGCLAWCSLSFLYRPVGFSVCSHLFASLFYLTFSCAVRFVSALLLRRCSALFSCFRFWIHFRRVVLICSGMFLALAYAMPCTLFYNSIFQLKDNKNESKANKGKRATTRRKKNKSIHSSLLRLLSENDRWTTK